MWNKLYLAAMAISIAAMAFFTFYSASWLRSIGSPLAAIEGYTYNAGAAFTFLICSWIVLIVLATAIAWAEKPWALWTSFLYFALFALAYYFWLDRAAFHFKQSAGLTDDKYNFTSLLGIILVVVAGFITFAIHFMVAQLKKKMSMTETPDAVSDDVQADVESSEII